MDENGLKETGVDEKSINNILYTVSDSYPIITQLVIIFSFRRVNLTIVPVNITIQIVQNVYMYAKSPNL